jgi:hypothetical protein
MHGKTTIKRVILLCAYVGVLKVIQFIVLQTSRFASCIRYTAPNESVIMIGRLGRMFKVAVIASLKVIFCVDKLHVLPASGWRIKPKVCSSA